MKRPRGKPAEADQGLLSLMATELAFLRRIPLRLDRARVRARHRDLDARCGSLGPGKAGTRRKQQMRLTTRRPTMATQPKRRRRPIGRRPADSRPPAAGGQCRCAHQERDPAGDEPAHQIAAPRRPAAGADSGTGAGTAAGRLRRRDRLRAGPVAGAVSDEPGAVGREDGGLHPADDQGPRRAGGPGVRRDRDGPGGRDRRGGDRRKRAAGDRAGHRQLVSANRGGAADRAGGDRAGHARPPGRKCSRWKRTRAPSLCSASTSTS